MNFSPKQQPPDSLPDSKTFLSATVVDLRFTEDSDSLPYCDEVDQFLFVSDTSASSTRDAGVAAACVVVGAMLW